MIKAHLRLWIIGMFLLIVGTPFLMPPEFARGRIMAEYTSTSKIFGVEKANALASSATATYTSLMDATGLGYLIRNAYVKEKDLDNLMFAQKANRDMSSFSNNYLQTFATQIYSLIFRAGLMLYWMIYVGPFLVASLMDGVAQRQVKNDLIRMNAPIKFAMASHAGVLVVFTPLLYLLLPVHVTPWFMPVWAICMAYPIASIVSNFAKTS